MITKNDQRWLDKEETKQKISKTKKGIKRPPYSSEWKENLSNSSIYKGKKSEKLICPYCNTETALPVIFRYHFDNCKSFKKE